MTEETKPLQAPITVEKNFLVAGKRLTLQVIFPAHLGKDIGMENVYAAAQRIIIRLESKNTSVKEIKPGE